MNDEIRMSNDELPDGWLRAPFSSVAVDPIQRVPGEKEKITYIDIGSVDRATKTIVEPQSMLGKDAPSRARKVIQTGDVLVSTVRPNLNAVALVESQYDGQFASTGFDVLRSPVMDSRWLFYSVRTPEFLDRMSELVQGALYPAVRSFDIRSFVIPIAPLAEQKRIADKLEAVLGRVDACRARLVRVPALLKRFRQSVLAAATSGRLTAEWRMTNAANDEWEEVPLGRVVDEIKNGLSPKPKEQPPGTPILRISSVRTFQVHQTDIRYLSPSVAVEPYRLIVGDLLFTRYNGSLEFVGVCGLVRNISVKGLVYPDKLIRVRVNQARVLPDWIEIAANSPQARDVIENKARTSAGQTGISGKDLKELLLPIPTLPEQQEIVRRVEDLFAFADRIEARLAVAQKTIERLTPSVLAKAFRGELVPQDPTDEPASALLDRLRTQPVTPPTRGKRPKRS